MPLLTVTRQITIERAEGDSCKRYKKLPYRLIDGSGKAFIQDGAFVLLSQSKLQRHHERVSEVGPGLSGRKRGEKWKLEEDEESEKTEQRGLKIDLGSILRGVFTYWAD